MGSDGWYGTGVGVALGELSPGQTASATFTGEITLRYRWVEDGPWDLPPSVSIIKMEAATGAVGQVRDCTTGLPETIVEDESTKFANGVVRKLEAPDIDGNYTVTFNPSASRFVAYSNEPLHGPSASAYVRVTIIPLKIALLGVVREKSLSCMVGQQILAFVPNPYATIEGWKPPFGTVPGYSWGLWGTTQSLDPTDYYECRRLNGYSDVQLLQSIFVFVPNKFSSCIATASSFYPDPTPIEINVTVSILFEGTSLGSVVLSEFLDCYPPIVRFSKVTGDPTYIVAPSGRAIGASSGNTRPGIEFALAMNRPDLFAFLGPGKVAYVQLAMPVIEYQLGTSNWHQFINESELKLDNAFPYEPNDLEDNRFGDGWDEPQDTETIVYQVARDTPSFTIGDPLLSAFRFNNYFQMFFSYLPPPHPEVGWVHWQGTSVQEWRWQGSAVKDAFGNMQPTDFSAVTLGHVAEASDESMQWSHVLVNRN